MATVFRVTARDGGTLGEAASIDGVVEVAKGAPPGRYRIEKVARDPATGEVRCWEWGTIAKDRKGRVKLDLPPWID
jgi:hypothetical protein